MHPVRQLSALEPKKYNSLAHCELESFATAFKSLQIIQQFIMALRLFLACW